MCAVTNDHNIENVYKQHVGQKKWALIFQILFIWDRNSDHLHSQLSRKQCLMNSFFYLVLSIQRISENKIIILKKSDFAHNAIFCVDAWYLVELARWNNLFSVQLDLFFYTQNTSCRVNIHSFTSTSNSLKNGGK